MEQRFELGLGGVITALIGRCSGIELPCEHSVLDFRWRLDSRTLSQRNRHDLGYTTDAGRTETTAER